MAVIGQIITKIEANTQTHAAYFLALMLLSENAG